MIMLPIPSTSPLHFCMEDWENILFELGSERVKISLFFVLSLSQHSEALGLQQRQGEDEPLHQAVNSL